MTEPGKYKAIILEDSESAKDILLDYLGDDFDSVWCRSVRDLHEHLISGLRPRAAFVDLQLQNESRAGHRALELLRGLSPKTTICVISADLKALGIEDYILQWPLVRKTISKGELSKNLPDFVETLRDPAWVPPGEESQDPNWSSETVPGRVSIAAKASEGLRSLGLEADDAKRIVALTFPLDDPLEIVMVDKKGLSGAIGLGVVARRSKWRTENSFFFLKVGTEFFRNALLKEFDNYRWLWGSLRSTAAWVPWCYGIVRCGRFTVLVYEYLGVSPGNTHEPWEPAHFDRIFTEVMEDKLDVRAGLRERFEDALAPLENLILSPTASSGRWLTVERRGDLERLCEKAARATLHRLGRAAGDREVERFLTTEDLRLEEIELVDAARGSVPNPLRRLKYLDLETDAFALNLGTIHGDLHSRNMIHAGGSQWALIDFGSVSVGDLQMLDAARLTCDLLFEQAPILPLAASYQLASRVLAHAGNVPNLAPPSTGTRDPKIDGVERAIRIVTDNVLKVFRRAGKEKVSRHQEYLYALLYESVRWMTHGASPTRFLQRLLFGSRVCDALDALRKSGPEVVH